MAIRPRTELITNAVESARRLVPSTRLTIRRATRVRSTNSPIAAITVTNISQRVTNNCADTALEATAGTRNWGAGPGFGPTAYVNAPCTGWPSTEIARQ